MKKKHEFDLQQQIFSGFTDGKKGQAVEADEKNPKNGLFKCLHFISEYEIYILLSSNPRRGFWSLSVRIHVLNQI